MISLALCSLILSGRPAPRPASALVAAKVAPLRRGLKKRTLKVTDDSGVTEVHVAGGLPTTLTFALEVNAERVLLADTHARFFDPQVTGRTLVLVPKQDLSAEEPVTLQVTLADGTLLPFLLVTVPAEVDLTLDVELELKKRLAPESLVSLKSQVVELQGRLDECQSTGAEQGTARVAALILSHEPGSAEAFSVARHSVRELDKQERLLVQTLSVYRLFDVAYLVLSIENRDPSRPWMLERAEVAATGGANVETRVVALASELTVVAPGETSRVVIGFAVPGQELGQKFTVRLFEKGGARHVALTGLGL